MAKQAYIVTDIGFGDSGKGTTVDYLVRQSVSSVVIRHNGGAQAAHNVVTPSGLHHTFAQFGSGSLIPGVKTHLSRFMIVNPLTMLNEGAALEQIVPDIWRRVSVDRDALVTTPWQQAANQLRELARGQNRHGSCGLGVGETVSDSLEFPDLAIRVGDLAGPNIKQRLIALRDVKFEQIQKELPNIQHRWPDIQLDELIAVYRQWLSRVNVVGRNYLEHLSDQHELMVFEGAQGVLLDEWYGFNPYTTWSTTTHTNAPTLLDEIGFSGQVTLLGVMRGYTTRHGAGPFVTEDKELTAALPDYHNGTGEWQGDFRIGYLDLVAHRYALDVCQKTDELVVTGLDRVAAFGQLPVCIGYRLNSQAPDADKFFEFSPSDIATAIKLGVLGDLDRQTRLSELLMSCTPVYQAVNTPSGTLKSQEEYIESLLRTIEERLGVPITIASFGPTWAGKRAFVAC